MSPAELGRQPVDQSALEAACRGAGATEVRPHTDYQDRPLEWITEHLGVRRETLAWSNNPGYEGHEWDGTEEPMLRILQAVAEGNDVGVESGNATGKTFLLACISLWFLACFEDSKVVTVAPKQAQLLEHVWDEIGGMYERFRQHFPDAELLSTGKLRMKPEAGDRETWAATAFVCGVGASEKVATKAQGFHAEHLLVITEESPGIHPAIMRALLNTQSAPHNFQLSVGNPDFEEDPLHQFCTQPDVEHVRISALDHPNVVTGDPTVVPGAVSRSQVERLRQRYSATPALYKSRVRGVSPEQAFGAVLHQFDPARHRQGWTEEAVRKVVQEQRWPLFGGMDFGSWRFAFVLCMADRNGRVHVIDEVFSQEEAMQKRAERVTETINQYRPQGKVRLWGDSANRQHILELNRAFRRLGVSYRVGGVERENKLRGASVERLNDLLYRQRLLLRRELGQGMQWKLGQDTQSDGEPMQGSRLLWEIKNWRYPEPREDQAQKQDPDDDSADGADAIAALRYAIMSWWKAAKKPEVEEEPNPNFDPSSPEEVMERMQEQDRLQRRWW